MTLNQVITRLQKIALGHKQIYHCFFGDMVEWLSNGNVQYPAVFINMNTGSISKDERRQTWVFDIWFCDAADVSAEAKNNEVEVLSDLSSIAADYKAMLVYSEYLNDWTVGETSPLTFYSEKFEDIVIAAQMTVSIDVRFDSNRCQVPTNQIFENGSPLNGILSEDGQFLLLES